MSLLLPWQRFYISFCFCLYNIVIHLIEIVSAGCPPLTHTVYCFHALTSTPTLVEQLSVAFIMFKLAHSFQRLSIPKSFSQVLKLSTQISFIFQHIPCTLKPLHISRIGLLITLLRLSLTIALWSFWENEKKIGSKNKIIELEKSVLRKGTSGKTCCRSVEKKSILKTLQYMDVWVKLRVWLVCLFRFMCW